MATTENLDRDDFQRAFQLLEADGAKPSKIVANSIFEDLLFKGSVSIPIEFDDTETGVRVIGKSDGDDEEIKLRYCEPESFQEVSGYFDDFGDTKAIKIWAWEGAPQCLRQLSEEGGDEDWIILVPPSFFGSYINWIHSPAFGYSPSHYLLHDGWQLYICSH